MAVRTLLFAPLALFACSGHPDPQTTTETLPAVSCGPHGHILPDALPGDRYRAADPALQSVAVSNGTVTFTVEPDAWEFGVASLVSPSLPLVIQLRDVNHAT